MPILRISFLLMLVILVLDGCGAKPAMEGGQNDSSEYGSVKDASSSTGSSGNGDSTSFNDDNAEKVDEYVVRRGDNLWNIAAKGSVYHSGWLYSLILKANRGKIKNAKDLKVGLILKIPRGLSSSEYEMAREEAMAGVFESEVGPLQEMKTDIPMAPPAANDVKTGAPGGRSRGGFWKWVFGLILASLAIFGGWKIWMMRKRPEGDNEKRADGGGDRE